ncbi:peroxidase family protein [Labrys monachus]|uniref:Heme peroxidase n=1 Tax=Labrys monachus TaxID=217067 RepID=A0ABU0FCZ7_9HYPH|nr:peroxidase family protein [Labrys monachus]MDQ0392311.1 hypothetical protein [Labrys monachus]
MSGHGSSRARFLSNIPKTLNLRSLLEADVDPLAARAPGAGDPRQRGMAGFRHFIRPPEPKERFAVARRPFDPADAQQFTQVQDLMHKLADMIEAAPIPAGQEDGISAWFNRGLPSGFTYFMQFIAHDMVSSSLTLSRSEAQTVGFANQRRVPLRLDAIYGGGPAVCPHAYQPDPAVELRTRLRLGRTRDDTSGRLRDIARGRDTTVPDGSPLYPEALIADPRNDMHALISQMTVLFHHLHNAAVETLARDKSLPPTANSFAAAQRNFFAAQCACILIYRHLIREDLLPRILHPDVYAVYRAGSGPFLEDWTGLEEDIWTAPLEFTHGVMRFGHAMIRAKYSFNELTTFPDSPAAPDKSFNFTDIMRFNSDLRPDQMPLLTKWTVDWHRFFGDDPKTGNFSVRLGPWTHRQLEFSIESQKPPGGGSLIYRDLLGSVMTCPWSVNALIAEIARTHGDLIAGSSLLYDDTTAQLPTARPWAKPMSDWLAQQRNRVGHAPTDEDIAAIIQDPPMPFFVRFEAAHAPGASGKHLGIFGSIVMADTLFGVLNQDRVLGIDPLADLDVQLKAVSRIALDADDKLQALSGIRDFNSLIDYLGDAVAFPSGLNG